MLHSLNHCKVYLYATSVFNSHNIFKSPLSFISRTLYLQYLSLQSFNLKFALLKHSVLALLYIFYNIYFSKIQFIRLPFTCYSRLKFELSWVEHCRTLVTHAPEKLNKNEQINFKTADFSKILGYLLF